VPNPDDMNPVTHKELREKLDEAITHWAKRLTADLTQRLTQSITQSITETLAREVAHAVRSSEESTRSYMGVMLDKASADDAALDRKYSDLPGRVTRLETAVFPPKRQRRR
jgi:hypothetical protein